MLVIDANVAIAACADEDGFRAFGEDLAGPSLMWSEARANLHRKFARGEIEPSDAAIMHERLEGCPVQRRNPLELGRRAWEIADEFGWSRTYDAEYVALAQILGCRLVTLDGRLHRGVQRLGLVVTLDEL